MIVNLSVMKRIFFLLFCLVFTSMVIAQESKSEKQLRKEKRDAELRANYLEIGAAIDRRSFVIEMEYLLDASGNNKKLNMVLNFISVEKEKCFWASESSDINTDLFKTVAKVEGTIDGWKLERNDKKQNYYLQFKMFTDFGIFYVTSSVMADKTVSGNISGVRDSFTYSGRIIFNNSGEVPSKPDAM